MIKEKVCINMDAVNLKILLNRTDREIVQGSKLPLNP